MVGRGRLCHAGVCGGGIPVDLAATLIEPDPFYCTGPTSSSPFFGFLFATLVLLAGLLILVGLTWPFLEARKSWAERDWVAVALSVLFFGVGVVLATMALYGAWRMYAGFGTC